MTTLAINCLNKLKENKKVCLICDYIQMFLMMSIPIAVPFVIMWLAMNNGF